MESKLLKEPKTKAQKNNNHYLLGIYKAMTKRFILKFHTYEVFFLLGTKLCLNYNSISFLDTDQLYDNLPHFICSSLPLSFGQMGQIQI